MSARSCSFRIALLWSALAVASAVMLAAGLSACSFSLPYGFAAGALFGLVLGAVGVVRQVSGRTRTELAAGVSRRDIAFAGSFAVVTALGWCAL